MRLIFATGREVTYTRNKTLFNAFSKNADILYASSDFKSYPIRLIIVAFNILRNSFRPHDAVFIGFYGQPLVLWARLFTNKPIVFDAFISTYQTLCFDRKSFRPDSIMGKIAFFLDMKSCQLADVVLLDTDAHCDYFAKTFNLPRSKFKSIFVSADEEIFYPRMANKTNPNPVIFTYTAYQPLHGTQHIIKAAANLKHVDFVIAGTGKMKNEAIDLARKLKTKNVKFLDWVDYKTLPIHIANSDICLGGHFGETEKAKLVIAGKSFQFIAMKKPTIFTSTPANLELFNGNEMFFCEIGSGDSLTDTIKTMLDDRNAMNKIAKQQYDVFVKKASNSIVDEQIRLLINDLKPN